MKPIDINDAVSVRVNFLFLDRKTKISISLPQEIREEQNDSTSQMIFYYI